MKKILNFFISKIKKESYAIDDRVPAGYLLKLVFQRLIMAIYGVVLFRRKVFVSPYAIIKCKNKINLNNGITISRGCYIDALSVNGITFGKNVSLGKYTTIECTGSLQCLGLGLNVGNNVGLGSHGFLGCAGGINIGDDTILGNYVSMHSENHNFNESNIAIRKQGVSHKGIVIGKDCWIGSKVTILDGAEIGDGCIIAAGAVVTSGKYEDYGVYAGVPAKLIKKR